jgi:integrase
LAAWAAAEDADLFLAIGLELSFGLRLGEVRQARWGWLTVRAGVPMLDTSGGAEAVHVKNRTGAILVRALDPYWSTLRVRCDRDSLRATPADPVIRRPAAIGNAVSAFLRRHGWTTTRTNHALRDYAGSQVYMRFSPHDAMTWLRHGNVQVTTDYYTSFVSAAKMIDRDALGIEWATTTGQFSPVILPSIG